jgi:hypothetical protein
MVRINLPLGVGAEIEAEARLSQDANFPAVEIVERLDKILRAAAPSERSRRQRSSARARRLA